jgi:hypothetical protein
MQKPRISRFVLQTDLGGVSREIGAMSLVYGTGPGMQNLQRGIRTLMALYLDLWYKMY